MKELELSMGKVTIVDDEDYDFLSQWKWTVKKHRNTFYATRTNYDKVTKKKKNIKMHRVILGITDSKVLVDHRDRDGLNNQRYNLRTATSSQNQANGRKRSGSMSKYRGVCWAEKDKVWVVRVSKNKTHFYVGGFRDEKAAALAYNEWAIKVHGEFANLNKIEDL